MAKVYQEYMYVTYFCSCWASSSQTRERNNTRDIRACVYSPLPENGNGEIKMKREYVRNGPFRSSPVQLRFNFRSPPVFFLNGRPLYGSNGGTFFDAYRRFPHNTYPYSSCIYSFLQSIPTFCSFLNVFHSCSSTFL